MLIFAIFFTLAAVIGLCMMAIGFFKDYLPYRKEKKSKGYSKYGYRYWEYLDSAAFDCFGFGLLLVGVVFATIFWLAQCYVSYSHDLEFEQKVMLRESLAELMEDTSSDYKDSVYQAVVTFNSEVVENRTNSKSVWYTFQYSDKYDWDTIELITPKGEYNDFNTN